MNRFRVSEKNKNTKQKKPTMRTKPFSLLGLLPAQTILAPFFLLITCSSKLLLSIVAVPREYGACTRSGGGPTGEERTGAGGSNRSGALLFFATLFLLPPRRIGKRRKLTTYGTASYGSRFFFGRGRTKMLDMRVRPYLRVVNAESF